MELDDYLESLNGISWYQVLIIVLINIIALPTYFHGISGSFLSATPQFRCRLPTEANDQSYIGRNYSAFPNPSDGCLRYNYTFGELNLTDDVTINQTIHGTIPCELGWKYSNEYYEETTISEWDLICDRRTLDSIANSLFFFGLFVGALFFGIVSGRYGRKFSLFLFCLILNVATTATAFVSWFPLYVLLRVVSAATATGAYLACFTLSTELASRTSRVKVSMFILNLNSLQEVAFPLLAFYLRNWRHLVFTMGVMCAPLMLMFCVVPESPRWLLLSGRNEEAKTVVSKIFRSKKRKMDDFIWNQIVETETAKIEKSSKTTLGYLDLFKRPFTRIITINTMYCWAVVSMVSYGLILNVTNLAGDPYVNATLNGLVSFIGTLLVIFCGKFGRKRILCISFIATGISCLLSMLLKQFSNNNEVVIRTSVTMAFLGKLSCNLAYGMIYIVTAEAYPTAARGLGMGIGSMAARFGSVIMPFTLQLQYNIPWITQTIFGSLTLLAGLSTLLYPETGNINFLTTLDEAERFYASNMKTADRLLRHSKQTSTAADNIYEGETLIDPKTITVI